MRNHSKNLTKQNLQWKMINKRNIPFEVRTRGWFRNIHRSEDTTDTPFGPFGKDDTSPIDDEDHKAIIQAIKETMEMKKLLENEKRVMCGESHYSKRVGTLPNLAGAYSKLQNSFDHLVAILSETRTTHVSENYYRLCVQSLLGMELGKTFEVSIPNEILQMNSGHRKTITASVTNLARLKLEDDSFSSQLIEHAENIEDLHQEVLKLKKQVARLTFRQFVNVLRNRLELELNGVGFFKSIERQAIIHSMMDYHFLFSRYNQHINGTENIDPKQRFTKEQARVYAIFLCRVFPKRFGITSNFDQFSYRVAHLCSGILEFALSVAHADDTDVRDVEDHVNSIKQSDIVNISKTFTVEDIKVLYEGIKRLNTTGDSLLTIKSVEYPILKPQTTEFDYMLS